MTSTKKKLNVLMILDLPYRVPADQDFKNLIGTPDFEHERHLLQALKKLGHSVSLFGIFDSIEPFIKEVQENRPDLVFNQCESFNDDRDFESHIASLLELLGIPFTGASSEALTFCKDKALTKKILSYHGLVTPSFITVPFAKKLSKSSGELPFSYPAICKPLTLEGSEGISQASFVTTNKDCLDRIQFIHERFQVDCIVEEFIVGRELYLGMIGNNAKSATILPPRELRFKKMPKESPKIATYKAKWDPGYRKKWGISSGAADPIDPESSQKIEQLCRDVFKLFKLSGYARIDLRLTEQGDPCFLEANPNPALGRKDEFAEAALEQGIPYEALISTIIDQAFMRLSSSKKSEKTPKKPGDAA